MKYKAILFDCDGVLVDSEAITCGVLRDMLEASGWSMTLQECMDYFIGKTVRSESAVIEQRTGQPLTEAWMQRFFEQRNQALREGLQIIAGAGSAVQAAHAVNRRPYCLRLGSRPLQGRDDARAGGVDAVF
jgi:beta-phosphoglucomutase-like phosphatase (HAD superfamily)